MRFIRLFKDVERHELDIIGTKAESLVKVNSTGLLIAPGFIITNEAYKACLEETEKAGPDNSGKGSFALTDEFKEELIEAYQSLGFDPRRFDAASLLKNPEVFVSVRPSLPQVENISIPTALDIKGMDRLIGSIKGIYKDYLEASTGGKGVAIVVQKTIDADKAGICFTTNPEGINDHIYIKACFGLGSEISNIYPDIYEIDKSTLEISGIKISKKEYEFRLNRTNGKAEKRKLYEKSSQQVLGNDEIISITRAAKRLLRLIESDIIIEWAILGDSLYIFQIKPMNIEGGKAAEPESSVEVEINGPDEVEATIVDIDDDEIEEDIEFLEEIEEIEKKGIEPVLSNEEDIVEDIVLINDMKEGELDRQEQEKKDENYPYPENINQGLSLEQEPEMPDISFAGKLDSLETPKEPELRPEINEQKNGQLASLDSQSGSREMDKQIYPFTKTDNLFSAGQAEKKKVSYDTEESIFSSIQPEPQVKGIEIAESENPTVNEEDPNRIMIDEMKKALVLALAQTIKKKEGNTFLIDNASQDIMIQGHMALSALVDKIRTQGHIPSTDEVIAALKAYDQNNL